MPLQLRCSSGCDIRNDHDSPLHPLRSVASAWVRECLHTYLCSRSRLASAQSGPRLRIDRLSHASPPQAQLVARMRSSIQRPELSSMSNERADRQIGCRSSHTLPDVSYDGLLGPSDNLCTFLERVMTPAALDKVRTQPNQAETQVRPSTFAASQLTPLTDQGMDVRARCPASLAPTAQRRCTK